MRVQEISGIYGNENTGQRSPQIKMEKVPCVRAIKGGEDMCSSGGQMLVVKIPVGPEVGPEAALRAPRGRSTENKKWLLKPSMAGTPGFTEHRGLAHQVGSQQGDGPSVSPGPQSETGSRVSAPASQDSSLAGGPDPLDL